ncbi:MAG TPA: hypothetical protein VFX12_00330 [Vicinamibacterales bacterium]|nr:hypothetical protein [Vicinamibacterales bacterium]
MPDVPNADPKYSDPRLIPGGLRWGGAERTPVGINAFDPVDLPGGARRPPGTDFKDSPNLPR